MRKKNQNTKEIDNKPHKIKNKSKQKWFGLVKLSNTGLKKRKMQTMKSKDINGMMKWENI